MIRRYFWSFITLCLMACSEGGLSPGPNDGGADVDAGAGRADEYEAELFAHTRTLDEDTLSALTHEDADLTLHFEGSPLGLKDVSRGSVLVAGMSANTPSGLLRLVTGVDRESAGLAVHTMYAPLQLAFKRLHVRAEREIRSEPFREDLQTKSGGGAFPAASIDFYAFNGDGDESTKDDQVHVTGQFEAGFSYLIGVDTDWGDLQDKASEAIDCVLSLFSDCDVASLLPEVKVGFAAKAGADASLSFEGVAFLGYERELELAQVTLDPFTIGGILVFVPSIEVLAGIEGAASSRFALSTTAKAGAEADLSFSSKTGGKLVPPMVTAPTFTAPKVDATLSASGRVRVGPRLHLRLYDLFGPYASFYAFAALSADVQRTPCYELEGGLEGDVGIELVIDTPVLELSLGDFRKEFGLAKETIASGSCTVPAGGIPAIDEAFANPTFTPWSKAYANTLNAFQYSGPGAQLTSTRVQRTIDGHTLVTGTASNTLLKLDQAGGVVWAKQYVLPEAFDPGLSRYELSLEHAASGNDAGLVVTGYPYTLLALDQAGKVRWASTFAAPYYNTFMRFAGIVAMPDGTFVALANYADDALESKTADHWLLKLDAAGTLLWSRRIGEVGLGDMGRSIVALDDDVVVVGSQWDPTNSFWRGTAMRVSADGVLVWSERFTFDNTGSEVRAHMQVARRARDGDILVGGMLDGTGPGEAMVVLKLKPEDGAIAWSNIESTPDGYLGMELTDLVELPTSGMLAVGNYARIGSDVWLAGLDGVGKIQWLRRYGQLIEGGSPQSEDTNNPGLLVTDDGGALVISCSEQLAANGEKGLWALKVPAKNGEISLNPSVANTSALTHQTLPVTVTASPWLPPIQDLALLPTPIEITTNDVDTKPRTLAP